MFEKLITRPIFSVVISTVIVIMGIMGLTSLPMTLYPDIAPPCVFVRAQYPGANAQTTLRSVAPVIEEAINGVENMTYMTTNIGNDGSMSISVYFKLGTNPDIAAVNVQNRVATITSQLPEAVVRAGITTEKQQNSTIYIGGLRSKSPDYDEVFIQNYLLINAVPEMKRITGVSRIELFGMKNYAMRVWLKPDKMGMYGITPEEVAAAIQEQNVEIAPGSLGENSGDRFQYIMTYRGRFTTPEEFSDIVLRADSSGEVLRLKDVAQVEFDSYTYNSTSELSQIPGIAFAVYQTSGSNANEIQIKLNELIEEQSKELPSGLEFVDVYTTKTALDSSINQVIETLIQAFILVFIVVYVFLQNWRSTLIIGVTIPVSIVGTFFGIQAAGLSINLLTLFSLVLSVGIVVDNAVVVIEAVNKKMNRRNVLEATRNAIGEISGAVVSSTLVMIAVFAPVGFIEGSVGLFYRQFSITMMVTITISGICALTLCPALAVLLIRPEEPEGSRRNIIMRYADAFGATFNYQFAKLSSGYMKFVSKMLRNPKMSFLALVIITAITAIGFVSTPSGFIPDEDDNTLVATLNMPPATSVAETKEIMAKMDSIIMSKQYSRETAVITGYDMMNSAFNSSAGTLFIALKEVDERDDAVDIWQIIDELSKDMQSLVTEGIAFVSKMPTIPGFGNFSGLEMQILDRTAGSLDSFVVATNTFLKRLEQEPEVDYAVHAFRTDYPTYEVKIDHSRAKQSGVSITTIANAMQMYYGSIEAADFARFGKNYKVIMQAKAEQRRTSESLNNIFVATDNGEQFPLSTFVTLKESQGPMTVARFNMYNSILVNVAPAPGYSTGQLMEAIKRVADESMPQGMAYDWQGMAREEANSGSSTTMIFLLSSILIFLVLAAQYESLFLPFAILLSVPTALFGVITSINIAGISNNIFVQIAMLMLIGLIAKNSILIVENALQLRLAGHTLPSAAALAAKSRLRPILMTSLTSVIGTAPMIFVTGVSAVGNQAIGVAVVGGFLTGIIGGVLITPSLFVIFRWMEEKVRK